MPKIKDDVETFACVLDPENHADLPLSDFYVVKGGMYSALGHLPICKECFDNLYAKYLTIYHDKQLAMRRVCMAFDLYYSPDLVTKATEQKGGFSPGKYLRSLNYKQYIDVGFDKSIEDGEDASLVGGFVTNIQEEEETEEENIDPALVDKWGMGLCSIDYDNLEKHYEYLKNANPNCDSNQEIFIEDLCYTKMQQLKAVREGRVDDYNKMADAYRKTFTQAGLKTVRDTSEEASFKLGVTIQQMEKYTPAEFYKNKKKYCDHDGFGEYFENKVLRPLRNLQTGTHDRDPEDYVKELDDDEEPEITEDTE